MAWVAVLALIVPTSLAQDPSESSAHVRALAVAQLPNGTLVGSTSDMTVRVISNGTGNVFVSTVPLAQIDMQGSARLAVKVASVTTGIPVANKDFLFLIQSDSTLIGGPSAGGILTVATIAALEGWPIRNDTLMTGTINPDGTIGPVGGVPEKAAAAAQAGARRFLYPTGQEAQDGDIVSYCRDTLGITCSNVTTIEDAVAGLTGHQFAPRATTNAPVTSVEFTNIMRNATSTVLATARAQLAQAQTEYANQSANLPRTITRSLQQSLDLATTDIQNASDEQAAGAYYTLSSRASAANIETRYVLDTVVVAQENDTSAGLARVVDSVTRAVNEAANGTRAITPLDSQNVQFAAAAQSRVADAARTRDQARSYAENASRTTQFLAALHDLAYAEEQAKTGTWWTRLATQVPSGAAARAISIVALTNAAQDAVASADDTVTYANLLVTESQADPTQLQAATSLLANAKDELAQGLVAAATFDATEANVRGSLAIELIGVVDPTVLEQRIQLARSATATAIAQARATGTEPVMAQSYYELATTSASSVDTLALLQQARTVASLDPTLTSSNPQPRESALVPIVPGISVEPVSTPPMSDTTLWFIAVGCLVAGLSIGHVLGRSKPARRPPFVMISGSALDGAEPLHPTLLPTPLRPIDELSTVETRPTTSQPSIVEPRVDPQSAGDTRVAEDVRDATSGPVGSDPP